MPASQTMDLKAAIIAALAEEMRRDASVFYFGEDVGEAGGVFKQTDGLFAEFGSGRVIDTPISEPAIMGMTIGAAMSGSRPVTEIMFGDFITLAMDSLVNQAAKVSYMSAGTYTVPVVLRTAVGIGGALGPQHSQSFHVWLAHVPGLKVVAPSTPADAKGLMKSAVRDNNPVIFFEDRMSYNQTGEVPDDEFTTPLGVADVKREGQDVTIVAVSRMVGIAMAAADQLEEIGISVEVVDPRTIAPLDVGTIVDSVKKTSRALVVDGGHELYGITGEIAATIGEQAFDYLDAPVSRLAVPQVPIAANRKLEKMMVPSPEKIVDKVRQMFPENYIS